MNIPDDVREVVKAAMRSTPLRDIGDGDFAPDVDAMYDAALSALEAAGWECAPKEATPEMERAGADCFGGQGDNADARYEVSVMYRAMLTASRLKEKDDV